MGNIQCIVDKKMCISCGICVGVCNKNSVKLHKKDGQVEAVIDYETCTNCGMCERFCPGADICKEAMTEDEIRKKLSGNVEETYVGWARDKEIQRNAVSGGVVTAIVRELLKSGLYQSAVGVETKECGSYNKMHVYNSFESCEKYQKSKYFMASYEDVVRYIRKNKNARMIIIGVGCIIDSLQRWMSFNGIKRENYLFIGLLCDRTLSYGIIDYFRHYDIFKKRKLKYFEYRMKESNSFWPGNVKLAYMDKDIMIPAEERYNVCEYFQNERCLYCLNHMNTGSDISVGDNYTTQYSNKWGSNSVVVRTEKGKRVISLMEKTLKLHQVGIESIEKGQALKKKIDNYKYTRLMLKEEIPLTEAQLMNVNEIVQREYDRRLECIKIGRKYHKNPYLYNLYFILKGKSKIKNRLKVWK